MQLQSYVCCTCTGGYFDQLCFDVLIEEELRENDKLLPQILVGKVHLQIEISKHNFDGLCSHMTHKHEKIFFC